MKTIALATPALFLMAAPLCAQICMETGGGEARLDQLPATSLTAFGGSLDALLGHARVQFAGNADDHFGLGVAGKVSGSVHYRLNHGGWRIDAGPVSQAGRGIGEQWAGTLAGDLRAERDVGRVTVGAGWQQGVARAGSYQSSWHRPDVSAGLRIGSVLITTTWQSTVVQDSVLRATAFVLDPQADTMFRARVLDIQDVTARMAVTTAGVSLSARVGRRFGASIVPQTWWEGHAAFRLTPIMSVTMRTGHLASDPVLRLRGGQYTTLGLRLDLLPRTERVSRPVIPAAALAEIVRETSSTIHVFFVLPASTKAAKLAGDLTDWRSVNLVRAEDGRWEAVLDAKAGVYRMNIRTNDGPWRVPPGLPVTKDGFGAKVGLLVLEQ
jgi:hypothetical protein